MPVLTRAVGGVDLLLLLLLLLQEILNGGVDMCKEAGIPLAGEHCAVCDFCYVTFGQIVDYQSDQMVANCMQAGPCL
jgi:selenophosphate synthase